MLTDAAAACAAAQASLYTALYQTQTALLLVGRVDPHRADINLHDTRRLLAGTERAAGYAYQIVGHAGYLLRLQRRPTGRVPAWVGSAWPRRDQHDGGEGGW